MTLKTVTGGPATLWESQTWSKAAAHQLPGFRQTPLPLHLPVSIQKQGTPTTLRVALKIKRSCREVLVHIRSTLYVLLLMMTIITNVWSPAVHNQTVITPFTGCGAGDKSPSAPCRPWGGRRARSPAYSLGDKLGFPKSPGESAGKQYSPPQTCREEPLCFFCFCFFKNAARQTRLQYC